MQKYWKTVRLGNFAYYEKGKKPKRFTNNYKHQIPYIDIKAFEKGIYDNYTDGYKCVICYEDDLLMVWDGSRSGLVGKGRYGALGSTIMRINFPGIVNDYAFYFLKSKYQAINTRAKGTGTPHVDPNLLWNYHFVIPPLPEQHAIVAKIEALMSKLDHSTQNLQAARQKLDTYRQAVLKKAFEGELTRDWREKRMQQPEQPPQTGTMAAEASVAYAQFSEEKTTPNPDTGAGNSPDEDATPQGKDAMDAQDADATTRAGRDAMDARGENATPRASRDAMHRVSTGMENDTSHKSTPNAAPLPTADELLEQIRREREAYYQQQLEAWKKAVKEWEANGKKGKKPQKQKKISEIKNYTNYKINIPWNWLSLKVNDVSFEVVDCLHSTPDFVSSGKACVDTTSIMDGRILWDKMRYVSKKSFNHRISRLKPQKGDIFFAREGTVGTTLVLNTSEDVCLGQRMMMFRPTKSVLSKFFMYFFHSGEFKKQYKPLIGGTTSPHLNISDIKNFKFPLPDIQEQHQIVREIESRLSVVEQLKHTIDYSLQKVEALRQSILKKAFEGRLLSEQELQACRREPDWEPAEQLLERIQAEKEGKETSTKN